MKHFYTHVFGFFIFSIFCPSIFSQSVKVNLLWQKTAQVQTIEFSPDDNSIITGGATGNCSQYQCGQIKIWRTTDGVLSKTITAQGMGLTNDIDISADGTTIISGNGTGYCYPNGGCVADKPGQFKFNINGSLQKSIANPGGNIYAISYSPDGAFIAAGTGYNFTGEIRIYDKNFALIRTLPGHDQEVDGLEFTPDKKYLISGGDDGTIKFWNYNTGALIRTLKHGDYLEGGSYVNVAISPDGQYVASAGQGYNMTTKIWRISDGALIRTLHINGSDGYNTVKFSPDGKLVVSGLIQYGANGVGWYGRILFWNFSNGLVAKDYVDKEGSPQSGGIRTIAFSSLKKNYLAYSVAGKLKLTSVAVQAAAARPYLDDPVALSSKPGSQAYPNPFDAATTIAYTVADRHLVTIKIYDNLGREVETLVKETKAPGTYTATFNASKFAPGIYFYKISIGNYVETKKLMLNK